jgi:C-methyltransferase-like protein
VFAAHGLVVVDVDEITTHGGSLRVHVRHAAAIGAGPRRSDARPHRRERVVDLLRREAGAGLTTLAPYQAFTRSVRETKWTLLEFLLAARREGKTVAGYGAPAKGNTLLNYCGVRSDLLEYTVDRSPHKQGRLLPGTRIPIHHPDRLRETRPDFVLILPWNIRDEIMSSMGHVREWGGQFVVPIPALKVHG